MQEEKTGASRYSLEAPQVSGQKWYSHPYPLDLQPVLISESHIFRAHGHVFFTREMTYRHFKMGRVPIRIWISDISRKFRRVDNWQQLAAGQRRPHPFGRDMHYPVCHSPCHSLLSYSWSTFLINMICPTLLRFTFLTSLTSRPQALSSCFILPPSNWSLDWQCNL